MVVGAVDQRARVRCGGATSQRRSRSRDVPGIPRVSRPASHCHSVTVRAYLQSEHAARSAVTGALLTVLAASNRWLNFGAGQRLVSARDEASFRLIALAAPRLPSGRLANQHAQVFAFNYCVGLISDALPIGVET